MVSHFLSYVTLQGKPMLILLFELLYFCEYGKIDHIAAKACTELTQG